MRGQNNSSASQTKRIHIGVDLLGSDTSPEDFIPAVSTFLKNHPEIYLTVFGTEKQSPHFSTNHQVSFFPVQEIIEMDDDPLISIRRKKNSSICLGIKKLHEHQIDAFVSAGNTGAIMASAKTTLAMLPGIDRPALLVLLPTKNTPMAVLDVGANVSYKAKHLLHFATMGIAFQKTRGVAQPTIGLLNIGSEEKKGTVELREAYQQLQFLKKNDNLSSHIFLGNIEAKAVFEGRVDVLVTDGFTGNIFLKTAEGISAFILDQIKAKLQTWQSMDLQQMLSSFEKHLHSSEYPGAILCGVEGIVVKCHGDSTPKAFYNAIKGAAELAQGNFLEKIKAELSQNR